MRWAAEYGIARSTPMSLLRKEGVSIRHPRLNAEDQAEMVRLFESGVSQVEIGVKFGRHKSVGLHVLEENWDQRVQGEPVEFDASAVWASRAGRLAGWRLPFGRRGRDRPQTRFVWVGVRVLLKRFRRRNIARGRRIQRC